MSRSSLVNPGKLKNLIKIFNWVPHLCVPDAMNLANYSNEEIADASFCQADQRALPGRSLKGLRVYVAEEAALLLVPPDCSEQCLHCAINNNIKCNPSIDHAFNYMACAPATRIMPPAFSAQPNPDKVSPVGMFAGMSMATAASKHKQHNCTYYMKKLRAVLISCRHQDNNNDNNNNGCYNSNRDNSSNYGNGGDNLLRRSLVIHHPRDYPNTCSAKDG